MKPKTKEIITILFVVAVNISCCAQPSKTFIENTKRIDAYLHNLMKANICEGAITFPAKHRRSKIKSDSFIISFVNGVFDKDITESETDIRLGKISKKKTSVKESSNGLIKRRNILLKGNYMRAEVIIEFIYTMAVRIKVLLTTTTDGQCGVYRHLMDFKLVKDFYIKDAKMLFGVEYDDMSSDTIFSGNLASLAEQRKDYRFSIPGSSTESWINEIFTKQYYTDSAGAYNYTIAPNYFIKLIKENKIAVIKDLLFSPNYVTSVNAMEALLYLSSVNKVQLTTELNDKIVQVKNGSFKISQQGAPDVFYIREGYKDLHMTDERVIRKYSSSM